MRNQIQDIGFTKTSSKGQVVIPTTLRKRLGIKEGTIFSVAARKGMIVLKKVESGLSEQDLKSLKLIEEAWKDIEQGRYRVKSKQSFLNELKQW
jgi:AbrB family looped-hinge helix DNA binding protein